LLAPELAPKPFIRPLSRWAWLLALAPLSGLLGEGCSVIDHRTVAQCSTSQDCISRGGPFASSQCSAEGICVSIALVGVGPGGGGAGGDAGGGGQAGQAGSAGLAGAGGAGTCTTNKGCIQQVGGPAVCREGQCYPLTSPQCIETFGDTTDDAAQVVGVMVPRTGNYSALGSNLIGAVKASFNEYKTESQGSVVGPRPPILVLCDELADPAAAATHLVSTAGAKTIIGPTWSTAVAATLPITLPAGVITLLPVFDDPLVEDTPNTNGQLWSCKPNRARIPTYWGNVALEMESVIKQKNPALTVLQTSLVVAGDVASQSLANRIVDKTVLNGKSTQQNTADGNFQRLDYGDYQVSKQTYPDVASSVLKDTTKFAPSLVVIISSGDAAKVMGAIESSWPTDGTPPPRPTYLLIGGLDGVPLVAADAKQTLLSRVFGLDVLRSAETLKLFQHFQTAFQASNMGQSPLVGAEYFYDCFWLNLYATYAATSRGKLPLANLTGQIYASKGIGVLNPPGTTFPVGSDGVKVMLSALGADADTDLEGASSTLTIDLAKGSPLADGNLLCMDTTLKMKDSGISFSVDSGASAGTLNCP
jgi:hypothetical protein